MSFDHYLTWEYYLYGLACTVTGWFLGMATPGVYQFWRTIFARHRA